MNSKTIALALALTVGVTLGGCASSGPHEAGGTAVGAIVGGLIGNQFGRGGGRVAATIAGAAIGGVIGNRVGADLDERERQAAYEAQLIAVRSGRLERWRGRDEGYYGYVEPGVAVQRAEGYCREYTHTVYIQGRPARATGLACRGPDGGWELVS